jgi:hypothetical protein
MIVARSLKKIVSTGLLPFAQKGTLNAALAQKYGKGEREHLKKKAWTLTDDEQPSGRGAKEPTKKKGTGATVVTELLMPSPPAVLQMNQSTEGQSQTNTDSNATFQGTTP